MIVVGLILLIAAVIVGVVGLMANGGEADMLTSDFSAFGYRKCALVVVPRQVAYGEP